MSRAFALLALLLLVARASEAGPWSIGKTHLYASFEISSLVTDELATPDGREATIPEFERRQAALYAEYGLADRWTVILSAPLMVESSIDDFGSAHGPGDLTLGLQRQLVDRGPWILAARLSVQAPTGDPDLGRSLLPTGSGVWEEELLLSLGRGLAGGRGWAFVEAGHRSRGGGFSDALVYRSQAGLRVGERWRLAVSVSGIDPYSSRGAGGLGSSAGLGDGVQYVAYGPEALVELTGGWLLVGKLEETARARNLATGVTARLGVALRR